WRAVRLARDRNFKEALPLLQKARDDHNNGRRSRLYKAQNPTSDPLESIFLRACDELKAYWELQKKLGDDGYLAANKSPAEALDAVVLELKSTKKSVGELTTERDGLATKFKEAGEKVTMLETNLGKETQAKKEAEAAVKDRNMKLEMAAKELAQ